MLGVDHYYALFPNAGICMTPEKAVKYQYSLDMLEALGMPPSVLEMQSGSASCYPPILPENLHGFYMTHVAFGMKGSNYYVFTGGPNFENTGNNTAIYDYHAPVSATGEIRPIYHVQKERNLYSHQNTDLLTVPRSYDVQLGFNWDMAMLSGSGPWSRYSRDGISMSKYTASLQLTLALSGRLLHTCEIGKEPELSAPLVVVSDQRMAKEKQENLIRFVQRGGKLLLTPMVPEYDEDFVPCTLLRDFLGITETERIGGESPAVLESGEKVYGLQYKYCAHGFAGQVLGSNESDGKALIEYKQIGSGAVAVMGAVYDYSQFCQMDMLELCLQKLGGVRQVESDSRNLMVTLFECEGRSVCFLLNLLAGAVTATLRIRANGKWHTLEHITVPAQAVMPIELLSDEEIF